MRSGITLDGLLDSASVLTFIGKVSVPTLAACTVRVGMTIPPDRREFVYSLISGPVPSVCRESVCPVSRHAVLSAKNSALG